MINAKFTLKILAGLSVHGCPNEDVWWHLKKSMTNFRDAGIHYHFLCLKGLLIVLELTNNQSAVQYKKSHKIPKQAKPPAN